MRPQPLVEWVLGHEVGQLAHQVEVAAAGEVGSDALLEGGQALGLQAGCVGHREGCEAQVGQGLTPPEVEGLGQVLSGFRRRPGR